MPRVVTALAILGVAFLPGTVRIPFSSGLHCETARTTVRVDAYPTRDGHPITGLTADDFDLLEDGKSRGSTASSSSSTRFGRRPPSAGVNSQREGFELARDASCLVFVLDLDAFHVDHTGSHWLRIPLGDLLGRLMGRAGEAARSALSLRVSWH